MLDQIIRLFSPTDWLAFGLFLVGWMGYSYYADRAARSERGLRGVTAQLRLDWGRQMVARENRITDAALIGNLMTSVSFYANTTIYIIAGLIAVAGTLDQLMRFAADLPFAKQTTKAILEAKLFLMIAIFVFAYFKFTWALRQYNFLSILIGGALPHQSEAGELEAQAQKFSALNSLGGDEFNRGIRAYYFGFAAISWFVSPAVFLGVTLLILAVLYRRDFRSQTLEALRQ
jgi:uncharacterized membrane protein